LGGRAVTGTGKKLEQGLSFSYFGPERGSPGRSGPGVPYEGGPGKSPRRRAGSAKEGDVREDGGAQAWDWS